MADPIVTKIESEIAELEHQRAVLERHQLAKCPVRARPALEALFKADRYRALAFEARQAAARAGREAVGHNDANRIATSVIDMRQLGLAASRLDAAALGLDALAKSFG